MSTLSDLTTYVRQRADQEVAGFLSDTELERLINTSLRNLWNLAVSINRDRFVEPDAYGFTTTSGQSKYSLDDEHMRIVAVDLVDGQYRYTLDPQSFRGKNKWQTATYTNLTDGAPIFRYLPVGRNEIRLVPEPDGAFDIEVWYIKRSPWLTTNDEVDGRLEEEWLEWAVLDVAINAKIKGEEAINSYIKQRDAVEMRIREHLTEYLYDRHYATDVNRGY